MRLIIFDDRGKELAQARVEDLTVNGETMRVDLVATVTPQWHPLSEGGGRPASAGITALMEHIIDNCKAAVRYSRVKYSSGPVAGSAVAALTEVFNG